MGPRTDPYGTPIGEDVIGDLEFPMETNWRRFDKIVFDNCFTEYQSSIFDQLPVVCIFGNFE